MADVERNVMVVVPTNISVNKIPITKYAYLSRENSLRSTPFSLHSKSALWFFSPLRKNSTFFNVDLLSEGFTIACLPCATVTRTQGWTDGV